MRAPERQEADRDLAGEEPAKDNLEGINTIYQGRYLAVWSVLYRSISAILVMKMQRDWGNQENGIMTGLRKRRLR